MSSSSSVVGSASSATVSIFDMVNTTASQATKLVGVLGTGIDMLDTFTNDARTRQLARSKLSMAQFYVELHEDTARDISIRQRSIVAELTADSQLHDLYKENYANLQSIIDELKSNNT